MLTIEDLRNPKRKSGFNHVGSATAGKNGGGKTVLWRAEVAQSGPVRKAIREGTYRGVTPWRSPSRKTPEEAAQNYCDYINGQNTTAPVTLNYPGHATRDTAEKSEEEIAALQTLKDVKAQKEHKQGYVYCIAEKDNLAAGVKVGYSTKPEARVGELQAGNCRELVLLGSIKGSLQTENALHAKYIKQNLVGEWFTPSKQLLEEFGIEDQWED